MVYSATNSSRLSSQNDDLGKKKKIARKEVSLKHIELKEREREEEKRKEEASKASIILPSQANTMDIQEPQTSTRKLKRTCKKLNARKSSGIPKQKRRRKIR